MPGNEFAGIIDESDSDIAVGTEVLGFTAGTQTASIALAALRVQEGETLLVHGAAGAVGTAAVQLARFKGATVVGTASAANQNYVRELGATAVVCGDGLEERVEAAAPQGVDVVLDGAGGPALDVSLELVKRRDRILTLVEHGKAAGLGVLVSKSGRSAARLAELAALYAKGDLRFLVRRAYPFTEAAAAHREIETGHGRENRSHVSLIVPRCGRLDVPDFGRWTSDRSLLRFSPLHPVGCHSVERPSTTGRNRW